MALKRLGAVDITSADTWTELYTAAASPAVEAMAVVNMVMRGGTTALVSMALTDGGSPNPADEDIIEWEFTLTKGTKPLLREGLTLAPGQGIYVRSSVANQVSAVAYGDERSTS